MPDVPRSRSFLTPRTRLILFWAATAVIASEQALGGVWDVLRTEYIRDVLEEQLRYPDYVAVIIGYCKIPGAVVLVVPGLPRLKEWVYAGVVFIYLSAVASHVAVEDPAAASGPLVFAGITFASWALRPRSRRDLSFRTRSPARLRLLPPTARAGTITFWTFTGIIAFVLLSGGIADLLRRGGTTDGMVELGYPTYFMTIIGTWKVLGTVALLYPRFPRLKEWAYAGAFFNFAGAFASHLASDSAANHVFWTGLFSVCVLVSWALRPSDRMFTSGTASPGPRAGDARTPAGTTSNGRGAPRTE
jgi:uncharacterized membrane protein YphA (DoxX/SURF4 family)